MKAKKILLFMAMPVVVFQALAQMKSGDNIVIRDKVNDDLYVAGGAVTVDAPIAGDLIAAGGTITVGDSISQDILVAGGHVIINGLVGDDVRCAGGTIKISKNVAGDVVVTGGTITIDEDVVIAGDLLVSGGEVLLDGEVNGVVKSASGIFTLNGSAKSDIDCRGGKIVINGPISGSSIIAANSIELGAGASFSKDVRYWNKEGSLDFANTVTNAKTTFDPSLEVENGKWHYLGFASFLMVLWYLGTALVMITIIQYLFSLTFKNSANTIKNASLKSLGVGFLFLIGVPIAVVIAGVTIIGLPVGLLLLMIYITVLLLATVIVSLLASNWINNTYNQSSWRSGRIIATAFGIFIVLKLASLTPFVGPLVMLLLACMAFGGILQNVKWKRNKALDVT